MGIGLRYARAVLATGDEAEQLYQEALRAVPAGWPFQRAWAQLAYGEWLRRRRRTAESRPYLRAARETFDALGIVPWSERARDELRAAGEGSPRRKMYALVSEMNTIPTVAIPQISPSRARRSRAP